MIGVELLWQGIAVGAGYAFVAAGFAIIYATTRTFHFAHGATYALAAYVYYACDHLWGLGPFPAVIVSATVAVAFGLAVDVAIYQPMRRVEASFLTLFAASFGILVVVTNTLVLWQGNSFLSLGGPMSRGISLGGGGLVLSVAALLQVVLALLMIGALVLLMRGTTAGVFLRAMGDSNELVEIFGFSSRRFARLAFFLGSLYVVPAAILSLYINGAQPGTATLITLIAISGTIIGGIGSILGAALGGLLLGLAENLGTWDLSSSWQPAIAFGLLLLFLVIRPTGILGSKTRRA